MSSFIFDPDAVLDYAFDWTPWLAAGETISSKTIVPTDRITVESSNIAGGVVTVWVSLTPLAPGETISSREKVTCRIVTNQGRTDDRTITLNVRER